MMYFFFVEVNADDCGCYRADDNDNRTAGVDSKIFGTLTRRGLYCVSIEFSLRCCDNRSGWYQFYMYKLVAALVNIHSHNNIDW